MGLVSRASKQALPGRCQVEQARVTRHQPQRAKATPRLARQRQPVDMAVGGAVVPTVGHALVRVRARVRARVRVRVRVRVKVRVRVGVRVLG